MKKSIFALAIAAFLFLQLSCGNKTEKENNTSTTDSTAVTKQEVVAKPTIDFAYFEKIAKEIKLEGIDLVSANNYCDTSSKSFTYTYRINNAKDVGADWLGISTGSVKRLGNKEDVVVKSLDDYKAVSIRQHKDMKGVTVTDFKQWENKGNIFYYNTTKGVSDQMGGKKNYNKLFARMVKDDVYLDIIVKVYDNKAELTKAESLLIKVMQYLTKFAE